MGCLLYCSPRNSLPRKWCGDLRLVAMSSDSQPRRAALAFIFVTVLIDMLAFGMTIPVLPVLVQQFAGGSAARGAQIFGVFGTAWALMQFVFSPVQGALSDRFGRRVMILISCT